MKIDIQGYAFHILFVDKDNERIKDCDGRLYANDFLIYIRNDLNPRMTANVIRHEISHAILCLQGRYSHNRFTQEDLCEFIGFQAPYICQKTNEIMEALLNETN